MLVLSVLRLNGIRKIGSLLSSPHRTILVQRMVQTRKSSALNEIHAKSDEPGPPSKKVKLSGSGMPDRDFMLFPAQYYARHYILQVITYIDAGDRSFRCNHISRARWESLESWSTRISSWRSGKCSHKCCYHRVSNAKMVLESNLLTCLLLLLGQILSRSFSNRIANGYHLLWLLDLSQSLGKEWSNMDTQITWCYLTVIISLTSATRTGSFNHKYTLWRNDETLFPVINGKNLMNVFWMTCRGARSWVWSCTTFSTPLSFKSD